MSLIKPHLAKKRSSDDDLDGEIMKKSKVSVDSDVEPTSQENKDHRKVECNSKDFVFNCECKSQRDDFKPSDKHQFLCSTDDLLNDYVDKWDTEHVQLPYSDSNINERNEKIWPSIESNLNMLADTLKKDPDYIYIENAIKKYNPKFKNLWNFDVLKNFFDNYLSDEDAKQILSELIPKIIALALSLPKQIRTSIKLLKASINHSITMTQFQCAVLLANAFFCTFPRPNDREDTNYPYINFHDLFNLHGKKRDLKIKTQKLQCIFHYFSRITSDTSAYQSRFVTFTRQFIGFDRIPDFSLSNTEFKNNVCFESDGVIEECRGALQVDFANKYIGGGVLNSGCVQEEIRFLICPELIVTLLFTEKMKTNECVLIKGVERFSTYTGYAHTFCWVSDYVDHTPIDKTGRRQTDIVAIDALFYFNVRQQFDMNKINRELVKSFVGFSTSMGPHVCSTVATGNWGCGVFNGDRQLKFLVQLMAATETQRSLIYYTFNDQVIVRKLEQCVAIIVENGLKVSDLYKLLTEYCTRVNENKKYILGLNEFLSSKFKSHL